MSTATELLRLVVHEITAYGQVTYKTLEQIENLLAAEPDAEPCTHSLHPDPEQKFGYAIQLKDGSWAIEFSNDEANGAREIGRTVIPLYTRPEPARKPMTEVEVMTGYGKLKPHGLVDFALGIRFAEKHHGIGGDDT